jgi:hypothetical protein
VTGGYSDWYLPAVYEMDIIYKTLKPVTTNNATSQTANFNYGINDYSVPPQTVINTTTLPAQTINAEFQSPSGAERLTAVAGGYQDFLYWTSNTGNTSTLACYFNVTNGVGQLPTATGGYTKDNSLSVRAVRRVAL